MMPKSPCFVLMIGAAFLLMTSFAGMVDARGGERFKGKSGNFSRSSAASGGSFSSRSGSLRSAQPSTREAGTARRSMQPTAGQQPVRQEGRQESASGRQQQRQDNQGTRQESSSERQQQRQDAAGENQKSRQDYAEDSREDWQEHHDQNREDWQDHYEDEHDDWDDRWHDDGDVAAALVVGAAVGVAVGVTAAAVASSPTYVTVLPCTATVVVRGSVTYYQCGSTWYTRGYQSGTVVYMVGPAPGM